MTPSLQAQNAYAAAVSPLRSARSAEMQIIGEVTARLHAASEAHFSEKAAALHDNRRLWARFAAAVADEANALPQTLRAQIFYLAEFTEHHSRLVLAGEGDIAALIDINTALLTGLGGTSQGRVLA